MRKFLFWGFVIFLAALLFCLQRRGAQQAHGVCGARRIVSLAPAITETLFALGLGERVAGVTEFCAWPREAALRPKVGGFREFNSEAIVRTGADLVIMPADMAHFRDSLEDIGICVQLFDAQSLDGFLRGVKALGALTGKGAEASELAASFAAARATPENSSLAPGVLFALLEPGQFSGPVGDLTVIGSDGFYSQLIEAAGGRNAYSGQTPYPRMSIEAILAINPDLLVLAAPNAANRKEIREMWSTLPHLKAARGGHILVLDDPGDTVPGPRSLATLKKIAAAIARIAAERKDKS